MTYNRNCAYCNDKYYVCNKCVDINSWKNVCCSAACFRNLIANDSPLAPKIIGGVPMRNVLRAGLLNGKTIDITGYDMELGRFDCTDGVTRLFSDFEYFIVPSSEFSHIGEKLCTLTEAVKEAKVKEPKKDDVMTQMKDALKVSQDMADKISENKVDTETDDKSSRILQEDEKVDLKGKKKKR